jgi:hypothetical protein
VIGSHHCGRPLVPIWMSQGLVAPEPWSPWLDRDDRDAARNGIIARATTGDLALAG